MSKRNICISAPGKIILAGEHAVVYGYPAIAAAIEKRTYVTLSCGENYANFVKLLIEILPQTPIAQIKDKIQKISQNTITAEFCSELPIGCGIGSSASFAAALSAALFLLQHSTLNTEKVNELAYSFEKTQHGNPSGVDNAVAVFGGFLRFQKISEQQKKFSFLKTKIHFPSMFLLNTGKPIETTNFDPHT